MAAAKQQVKRWLVLVWLGLPLISVVSLLLPQLFARVLNKALSRYEGFDIGVFKIRVKLFPARVELSKLSFRQYAGFGAQTTFVTVVERLELQLYAYLLVKGMLAGTLRIEEPDVVFQRGEGDTYHKIKSPVKIPVLINDVTVTKGQFTFIDSTTKPDVQLTFTDIEIGAVNITNLKTHKRPLPTRLNARAGFSEGTLEADCALKTAETQPTFDLNFEAKNVDLRGLNSVFKAYGKFDVNNGTLELYSEAAAKEGAYAGYVKPLIKDLDVLGPEDKDESFIHQLWEGLVGALGTIFENPVTGKLGSKIPFDGKFKHTRVHVGYAIVEVLHNAFVRALTASLDFDINIGNVKEKVKK